MAAAMNNRRSFLKLMSAAAAVSPVTAAERPNVLVIMTDDQGYGDFSCHGNPVLKTPNMDRLHAESVRFTDFHVAPMCTPTRGQLLSGVDALRNKATSVTAGRAVLRRELPTMANIFADNGYKTGIFGKWHLGDNYPYRPHDRGFQEAKYHLGFGMSSSPEFDNDYFNGRYQHNGVAKRFDGYCTDFWFSEAMSWMGERKSKNEPFLCYIPTNTPHGPQWVDDKYSKPYEKPGVPAKFFGMIANIDENMGKLEAFLNRTGLRENTIVIFMTDNGATAGFNLYNAGMRGRKTMIHEGGHRVPCFVRWPAGKLRPVGDVDTPAQNQDVLPTLVDLCALKTTAKFDGRSLAPVLKGTGTVPERMMVVQYGQIPKQYESTVIWGKWRLVNGTELYDIKSDPGQKTDIAAKNTEVTAKMKRHYDSWWDTVEPGLKEFCAISIGSKFENPTVLSSSDWEEIYADNPRHVSDAAGGPRGGPWNVMVETTGTYEVSLFRWHPNLKLPLNASREPQKMTAGELPAGKGLPIVGARLAVAGQELKAEAPAGNASARFRVNLKAGTRGHLHGWFVDAGGQELCGAFYAVIRRL
jgi:arylsulfatase A-like enzyme